MLVSGRIGKADIPADISINRMMVLITFLSNLVVARKPYLTQTLRLTLKPLRQALITVLFCTYDQINNSYMLLLVASNFEFSVTISAYSVNI